MFAHLPGFLVQVVIAFWHILPRLVAAWVVAFFGLVWFFHSHKERGRHFVTVLDARGQGWARKLRYAEPASKSGERMALSWFFRFWTNFASAPSLSVWSVLLPFFALQRIAAVTDTARLPGLIGIIGAWLFPGLSYAGSMLLSYVLKRVFMRERPLREGKEFGHRTKDPSFPSGHSLTSFAFWFGCAIVLFQTYGACTFAFIFLLAAATIVGLTGLSRVYLGVHFPSDVLGGYFIALVWTLLCFLLLHPVLTPIFV